VGIPSEFLLVPRRSQMPGSLPVPRHEEAGWQPKGSEGDDERVLCYSRRYPSTRVRRSRPRSSVKSRESLGHPVGQNAEASRADRLLIGTCTIRDKRTKAEDEETPLHSVGPFRELLDNQILILVAPFLQVLIQGHHIAHVVSNVFLPSTLFVK
jgi:hypothetical protein